MGTAPSPTTPANRLRWFHPTPARLLVVLLAIEGVLLLSKPWFPKGYAVLIAIASVGVTMVLMLVWWLLAVFLHWRFQFSLRSLLVATVAVAIPFSWLAVEMKAAREQREAVEMTQRFGGTTWYDYEGSIEIGTTSAPPGPVLLQKIGATPAPPGPMWLQKLLDEEFFADVIMVRLVHTKMTDKGLENLKALTQMKWLLLSNTKVTDRGMENLKALTQMCGLSLTGTEVTDRGLENLKALTHLQVLWLTDTKVTAQGIKKLQQELPKCTIIQ